MLEAARGPSPLRALGFRVSEPLEGRQGFGEVVRVSDLGLGICMGI